jgi:uncharacterized membrane protein
MKALSSILVCLAAWLGTVTAPLAASADYEFATMEIPIPRQPGEFTYPQDINDQGEPIATIRLNNLTQALIITMNRRQVKSSSAVFSCTGVAFTETLASAINDRGQVVGSCMDSPKAPSKQYGFVRDRNGKHVLLDFPGSVGTVAFGINGDGKVVGQYYGPLELNRSGLYRFHCFIWDNISNTYTQLDFPRADTYTNCFSINRHGQVMGEYITFNPVTNEYLERGWFVYDNGQFILDFPLSLEHVGGPAIYLSEMNDDGQIIGRRWNGGPEWNGLFLYDDGKFYDVWLPAGSLLLDLGGMNNKGQFVGRYAKQIGIDPFDGSPIYEHHGFVATPSLATQSRESMGNAGGKN